MAENTDKLSAKLFNQFSAERPYSTNEKYQAHLFDQYKLYVEMADRISARRQTANSYFLSINTALIGFVGYITSQASGDYYWLLPIAGVALSYLWYRLIRSYRDLNTGKYKVIHAIEKKLPLCPYDAEWEAIGRGENSKLYKPFTHIETGVPWVFILLHVFVFLRTVPWRSVCSWF